MKRSKLLYLILLLTLTVSGCRDRNEFQTKILVKVPNCNPSLDNVVRWEGKDALAVVDKEGIHRFELRKTDGKEAEFVGSALLGAESFAVFPYSSEAGPQGLSLIHI